MILPSNMKKPIFTLVFVLCAAIASFAQSDPMFLQQTNNRGIINPAVTGKGGDVNFALGIRQQWVGFSGPMTLALNGGGFVKEIRSGIGLNWISDEFGPRATQNIKLNYAYYIPFGDVAFLSLGLGMGILNSTYDESGFFAMDGEDEILTYTIDSKMSPDFDFGLEFNARYFEVGASVTHLTSLYEKEGLMQPMRNIYSYARAKLPINKHWDFIPGVTWYNTEKLNAYEVSTAFRYENNLCVTLVYRTPKTFGISAGINIYKGLRFAYSFDYGMDYLSSYNKGSHEILVSYNIPLNTSYVNNKLRFFQWKMF